MPRSAEIHMGDNVEHPAAPSATRFQFGPDARWYELYMMTKVSANDFDFVVFSARTSAELQDDVAAFQRDSVAFLRTADPASYTVLPHGTGINAYIRVQVNGYQRRSAAREFGATGHRTIGRPRHRAATAEDSLHDGKIAPVAWDRNDRTRSSLCPSMAERKLCGDPLNTNLV